MYLIQIKRSAGLILPLPVHKNVSRHDDCLCLFRIFHGAHTWYIAAAAVVAVEFDFRAGFFHNLLDYAALLADNVADFVGVDFKADNLGSVNGKLGRNLGNNLEHFGKNELSTLVCLIDCGVHNLFGNALDFDIHLDSGNTLCGARNLEVHIAEEVFKSLNIGKHLEVARFLIFDKTHSNARNRRFDGNAGVHKRHCRTAHGSHGRRAVWRKNVVNHSYCIGEAVLVGKHGNKRALCKCAVTDFASAGGTQCLSLARAVAGEVVLMHISFWSFFVKTFKLLRFGKHTKRAGCKRLGLSSCEHCRAVHARKHSAFAPDGTNVLQASAVGTDTLVEYLCANLFLCKVIKTVLNFALVVGINCRKML